MNPSRNSSRSTNTITIYHHTLNPGNGEWTLWASDKGLIRLSFPQDGGQLPTSWLKMYAPAHELMEDAGRFEQLGVITLLERYFAGEPGRFQQC